MGEWQEQSDEMEQEAWDWEETEHDEGRNAQEARERKHQETTWEGSGDSGKQLQQQQQQQWQQQQPPMASSDAMGSWGNYVPTGAPSVLGPQQFQQAEVPHSDGLEQFQHALAVHASLIEEELTTWEGSGDSGQQWQQQQHHQQLEQQQHQQHHHQLEEQQQNQLGGQYRQELAEPDHQHQLGGQQLWQLGQQLQQLLEEEAHQQSAQAAPPVSATAPPAETLSDATMLVPPAIIPSVSPWLADPMLPESNTGARPKSAAWRPIELQTTMADIVWEQL